MLLKIRYHYCDTNKMLFCISEKALLALKIPKTIVLVIISEILR